LDEKLLCCIGSILLPDVCNHLSVKEKDFMKDSKRPNHVLQSSQMSDIMWLDAFGSEDGGSLVLGWNG